MMPKLLVSTNKWMVSPSTNHRDLVNISLAGGLEISLIRTLWGKARKRMYHSEEIFCKKRAKIGAVAVVLLGEGTKPCLYADGNEWPSKREEIDDVEGSYRCKKANKWTHTKKNWVDDRESDLLYKRKDWPYTVAGKVYHYRKSKNRIKGNRFRFSVRSGD